MSYRLEKWALTTFGVSPYTAPELITVHLSGKVYGHLRFKDGSSIVTSSVVGYEGDDLIITQSGSYYKLGEVCKEYEKKFPNARERLFKQLKEECNEGTSN